MHAVLSVLLVVGLVTLAGSILRHPVGLFRFLVGLALITVAPVAAKRNYPLTVWASIRWRWLTRNLGLAHVDPHAQGKLKIRGAIGPSIGKNVRIERPPRQ
jgi:hypothetical protein